MSLTGLLGGRQTPKPCQEEFLSIVKELGAASVSKPLFRTMSGKTPFAGKEYDLLVPSSLDPTGAARCGTAFDYIARAMVARLVKNGREHALRGTVGEYALLMLTNGHAGEFLTEETKTLLDEKTWHYIDKVLVPYASGDNDISPEGVAEAAWLLSLLEEIYRSGRIPESDEEGQAMLAFAESERFMSAKPELLAMAEIFREKFLSNRKIVTPDSLVDYNPEFGLPSQCVGGADADICIDGTLYDFKTTKKCGYTGAHVSQLLGYAFFREANLAEGRFVAGRELKSAHRILCHFGDCDMAEIIRNRESGEGLYGVLNRLVHEEAVSHFTAERIVSETEALNMPFSRVAMYKARFGEVEYVELDRYDSEKRTAAVESVRKMVETLPQPQKKNVRFSPSAASSGNNEKKKNSTSSAVPVPAVTGPIEKQKSLIRSMLDLFVR